MYSEIVHLLCPTEMRRGLHTKRFNQLLSKGSNIFGALGHNNKLIDSKNFKLTIISNESDEDIVDPLNVSTGWGHSAVIGNDRNLYIFGRPFDLSIVLNIDKVNRMSNFFAKNLISFANIMNWEISRGVYSLPTRFPLLQNIKSVSASAGLTVALTLEGDVFAFGYNKWMQCGIPNHSVTNCLYQPVHIARLPNCIEVATGLLHCIALTFDGQIYTWGKGNHGQLGHVLEPSPNTASTPERVSLHEKSPKNDFKVVKVGAGFAFSAVITEDGCLYVWGKGLSTIPKKNRQNLLMYEDQPIPRKINIPNRRRAIDICCSEISIVVRMDDQSIWVMGMCEYDKNMINQLIEVQSDFNHQYSLPFWKEGKFSTSGLIVSSDVKMQRGKNRVSLIFPLYLPTEDGLITNKNKLIGQDCYDIVLHDKDAYLLPIAMDFNESELNTETSQKKPFHENNLQYENLESKIFGHEIIDYSAGWRHSLLIVKPITSSHEAV